MKARAVSYALLSAVLFGASTPAAKALLAEVDQRVLAGLLYCGAGLGVAIVRRALKLMGVIHRTREATLVGKEWFWLGAATLAGGVAGPLLLMAGLARTEAATASLLLTLEGVFTATIAWFVFREHVDRRIALGHVLHRRRFVVLGMVRRAHRVRLVRTPRHSGGLPRLGGGQ